MKKPLWLWVLNQSTQPHSDRFDGEDYEFKVGVPVEIPAPAARLIFGWGEDSKLRALQRLGWAKTSQDVGPAMERLDRFTFHTEDPTRPPHAPVGGTEASDSARSESEAGAAPRSGRLGLRSFAPGREQPAP